MLVSAINQHESATGIHMSLPSWTSLPSPTPSPPSKLSQSTRLSSLHHIANSHWLSNLHMVIYMYFYMQISPFFLIPTYISLYNWHKIFWVCCKTSVVVVGRIFPNCHFCLFYAGCHTVCSPCPNDLIWLYFHHIQLVLALSPHTYPFFAQQDPFMEKFQTAYLTENNLSIEVSWWLS